MPETDSLLPDEFADLEPFAPAWVLKTEHERYAKRLSTPMDEHQAFYDAGFPRGEAIMEYLDQFDLNNLPEKEYNLLLLMYSLCQASWAVEVWKQPYVPDAGAAYLDLVKEPVP